MEEVNQAVTAGSGFVASNKATLIFFYLKKYIAVIIPSVAIMAVCIIVMAMTKPLSHKETIMALMSTFMFSIFGSAAAILYFGISFPENLTGTLAQSGLIALCGMPGWVFVRACFNWSDVNNKKTIIDLIKQIKGIFS